MGCSGTGEVTAVPVANPAARLPIPVGHQILGLCRDEARGLIYAGDYFVNGVHAIDAALQSLVSTMDLSSSGFSGRTDPPPCCTIEPGAGRRTVALALAPEGDVLYAANYGTYDVARIDLATGEELDAFDGVVGPRQILVSADGGQLILAGVGGEAEQQVSALYVLDRATGKRVLEVPWGSPWPEWRLPPMGGGRGLSPGRRRARGLRRGRLDGDGAALTGRGHRHAGALARRGDALCGKQHWWSGACR